MRHLFAFLLTASIVAASGCTTSLETGNGVAIQDFSPTLSEVNPGEPLELNLKVKNIGSVKAQNVFAEVLGLDEDWAASSGQPAAGGEKLPQQEWCRYTDDSGHTELMPPDMVFGTEGETASCTWLYRTPGDYPSGFDPEYKVTARVYYDYRTDLVKSIVLVPTREMIEYNRQGRSLPADTVSATRSPVTVTAITDTPIRFWENEAEFPLRITVSNTGGGMVCLRGECKKAQHGTDSWNKLTLKVHGNGFTIPDNCQERVVSVWPGRDNSITCDLRVSTADIMGRQEKTLGITAEYSYFTDAVSSVTVI